MPLLVDVEAFAAVAALILGIAVILAAGRMTAEHADGEGAGLRWDVRAWFLS